MVGQLVPNEGGGRGGEEVFVPGADGCGYMLMLVPGDVQDRRWAFRVSAVPVTLRLIPRLEEMVVRLAGAHRCCTRHASDGGDTYGGDSHGGVVQPDEEWRPSAKSEGPPTKSDGMVPANSRLETRDGATKMVVQSLLVWPWCSGFFQLGHLHDFHTVSVKRRCGYIAPVLRFCMMMMMTSLGDDGRGGSSTMVEVLAMSGEFHGGCVRELIFQWQEVLFLVVGSSAAAMATVELRWWHDGGVRAEESRRWC